MKKFLLAMSLLCFVMISAQAQRQCGSMEYLEQQMQENPERMKDLQEIENHVRQFEGQAVERAVVTIPIVVHVVYRTSTENISDAQIQTQIDVLNEDFRRLNSDANGTWSQGADSEVEFCLATVDPNGNASTGITRTSTSVNGFGTNDAVKFNSSGGKDAWPRDDYLNFWVCNIGGGILGYAQFPGGPANTDGVVNGYQYTGTIGTATAPFDLGRTATHEVGHWLNLRHIWGDGGCGVDDFVSDTPLSDAPNYGCANGHSSCGSADMIENYMDYSDDGCMNLFTEGQKTRMQALFSSGGSRASLVTSNGCGSGASPTCSDGVQNGSETGVDCGGPDCGSCPTCDDGVQNGDETGVDCGGSCNACSSNCTDNVVMVNITLDNYPEETSWEITNAGGAVVASGGTYGNQADGSTVEVELCLTDGCYDFTINDAYGDGICCSYGNGSYTVSSGGTSLANGGSFASSETTNICVGGGPQPSCNDGVQNGNESGIDCGGPDCEACPTCSDGVQNGNESGIDCGGPDCGACPTCNDGVQNGDETGVDCGGSCNPCSTGGSDILGAHYFETGWDGWSDGGSDCYRYSGTRSYEGTYSIRIRDNSGSVSSMTSSGYDLGSYGSATVEFYFYPNSMENGEDFWLRYNDGSGWQTVATYTSGVSFNNNTFYSATVTLDEANYNLVNGGQFRFQCDASANADRVYIDQVTITGNGSGSRVASNAIVELNSLSTSRLTGYDSDISLSPNPASDRLFLSVEENINKVSIYSITGQMVYQSSNQKGLESTIDISALTSGIYLITVDTEEEVITQKFIKE